MVEKTHSATMALNIWPYADAALDAAYPNEPIGNLDASHVYETSDGEYQHILIGTNTSNVYLVVVVNVKQKAVEGHFKLDLGRLYGVSKADA